MNTSSASRCSPVVLTPTSGFSASHRPTTATSNENTLPGAGTESEWEQCEVTEPGVCLERLVQGGVAFHHPHADV